MKRYDLTDFEWSVIEPLLPNKRNRSLCDGLESLITRDIPWRFVPRKGRLSCRFPMLFAHGRRGRVRPGGLEESGHPAIPGQRRSREPLKLLLSKHLAAGPWSQYSRHCRTRHPPYFRFLTTHQLAIAQTPISILSASRPSCHSWCRRPSPAFAPHRKHKLGLFITRFRTPYKVYFLSARVEI